MFQKWRPLDKAFASLRSRYSYAAGFKQFSQSSPYATFRSDSLQDVSGSRVSFKPCIQISNRHSKLLCFRCRMGGHLASECKLPVRCYFCGNLGHKKINCRNYRKKKPMQSLAESCLDGNVDEALVLRSTWVEPNRPMDSALLDPDIASCLDNRSLDPSQSIDLDGHQLGPVHSALDLVGTTAKGRLDSQILRYFSHNLGMTLGLRKTSEGSLTSRSRRRSKKCCWIGKESRFLAPFRQRSSSMLWGIIGKGSMEPDSNIPVIPSRTPGSSSKDGNGKEVHSPMDNVVQVVDFEDSPPVTLEDYSSDSPAKFDVLEFSKSPGIELSPVPFEVISSFVILDDSVVSCNEAVEGPVLNPALRSTKKTQILDEVPPLEGKESSARPRGSFVLYPLTSEPKKKKKKVISSMMVQDSGPPIAVRRSPRFSIS